MTRRALLQQLFDLRKCSIRSRTYHRVPVSGMRTTKHTHVEVVGVVTWIRCEADGDYHFLLTAGGESLTCEMIPDLPLPQPKAGAKIIVRGISRIDPLHEWPEIHPVLSWSTT